MPSRRVDLGRRLVEGAARLGLNRRRIHQIETVALGRLRTRLGG